MIRRWRVNIVELFSTAITWLLSKSSQICSEHSHQNFWTKFLPPFSQFLTFGKNQSWKCIFPFLSMSCSEDLMSPHKGKNICRWCTFGHQPILFLSQSWSFLFLDLISKCLKARKISPFVYKACVWEFSRQFSVLQSS